MTNDLPKLRTLEEKLVDALKAADAAFEAGYPVKAHRIVQGAIKLCLPKAETKHSDGFCPRPGEQKQCTCHPKPSVYEDAMNH